MSFKLNIKASMAVLLLFISAHLIAQPVHVTGRIINSADRKPVASATVQLKGTSVYTQTNAQGIFSIQVQDDSSVLVISYVGYRNMELSLSGRKALGDIAIEAGSNTLDEVVVTGYTSQRKKDITGSVATVNVNQMREVPSGTPEQLLQGRASGVNVITSGSPGGESILRIRGITSFGGSSPLVIIDGTRGDLHDINPNDIQDISILKDAGSAAIYGATGASGVILVTTKRGTPGKTTFTYDSYYGTQRPLQGNVFHLLNTNEMANLTWMALKNSGQIPTSQQYGSGPTPVIPDYILIGNQTGMTREPTQDELDAYNIDYSKGPIYQIVKANKQGTDWFHEIFHPAPIQSHNLTASGGSDKSTYLLSLGYFNQQGTLINTYLKRYSLRVNTTFTNQKKNIRIGENLYAFYKQNPQLPNGNLSEGNVVTTSYREQPIIPVHDIFGGYAGTRAPGVGDAGNPVAVLERGRYSHAFTTALQGNVFAEIDVARHFTARTQFGGHLDYNYNYGLGVNTYENTFAGEGNGYSESSSYDRQWMWTNTVSYSNTFAQRHVIKVLAGVEAISSYGRNVGGYRINYFVDDPNYANLSTGSPEGQNNYSGAYASTISSFISQLDYAYNNRYLLGLRFRSDGASVFGRNNRYGYFPSVSAGWRIGQEKFMQSIDWLNDLKIRGSVGKLGSLSNTPSDNQYDLFGGGPGDAYYDISGTTTTIVQGFRQTRLGSLNTGWEQDIITNIGLDATLFHNKLDFSVEWYKKKISGLLFPDQVHIYGVGIATLPQVNIGNIQNAGVDASATYHGQAGKNFKFDIGLTFTKYKSKVINIPNAAGYFDAGGTRAGNFVRNQTGHPISAFYGYQIVGLFADSSDVLKSPTQDAAAPGRFKYLDANGDGTITDADRVFFGDPNPDFTYGLNLSASYKNFDFSTFFYGSQGNDVINYVRWWTDFYGSAGVKSKDILYNSWTPQNLNAKTPIAEAASNFSTSSVANSYYKEDGSYLRCKTLLIGYTMQPSLLNRVGIKRLRVYGQVANLFTITKYTGLDPELAGSNSEFGIDRGNYPNNQTNYIVGVNLSFQ